MNTITIIVTIGSCWFYSFIAAFSYKEVEVWTHIPLILVLLGLDVYFGLEIVRKLFTGIYKDGKTMMVTDLRLIRKAYLKNGAIADLLTFFPIQTLLCYIEPNSYADLLLWIKILRVTKLRNLVSKDFLKKIIYQRQMNFNENRAKHDLFF